jgi:hypothetical protein
MIFWQITLLFTKITFLHAKLLFFFREITFFYAKITFCHAVSIVRKKSFYFLSLPSMRKSRLFKETILHKNIQNSILFELDRSMISWKFKVTKQCPKVE